MRDRRSAGRRGALRFALCAAVALAASPAAALQRLKPFVEGRAAIVAHDVALLPRLAPGPAAIAVHAAAPLPARRPDGPVAQPSTMSGAESVEAQEHNPPSITTDFQAVADAGTIAPPDASGAVGPAHVLSVTAQDVVVHTRAGTVVSTTSLQAWWAPLNNPAVFDPHAFYDPYAQRFVFVAAADPGAPSTSSLLVAVSQTADPTGTWYRYRIDDGGGTTTWADAPIAGFNAQWITIQVSMLKTDGSFERSRLFMVDKADVYANGENRVPYGSLLGLGGGQVPAMTYDPNQLDHWLLQNWNGNSGGQGVLRLFRLTGPVAEPGLDVRPFVTSYRTWASTAPPGGAILPQAGTGTKIYAGDARMRSLVYRGGSLYAAQTVFLPATAPARASVQWWEIGTQTEAVRQVGRIDDASGTAMYAYPALTMNASGDVMIAANRFTATDHPSAVVAFRYGVDPPNTLRAPVVARAGTASYVRPVVGVNRWGDYATAQVDPVDDNQLWAVQPYAALPDRWGTWWSRLRPNPAPAIEVAPGSIAFGYHETGMSSATEAVTVTSAGQLPAAIASVTIAGTDAAEFAINGNSCTGQTLQPGQTCAVGVRFAPTTTGTKNASLVVASDAPTPPPAVVLSGIGVLPGPRTAVSPTSIAFGNQSTGAPSAPRTITVTNVRVGTLQPGPVSLGGTDSSHFAVVSDGCTGAALSAGQSCSIGLAFAPSVTGPLSAHLRIDSNTYWSPDYVALSGVGIPPGGVPAGSFSPSSLQLGDVHVGTTSAEVTSRLVNTGTGPLTLGTAVMEGAHASDFRLVTNTCDGVTVNPGSWCTLGAVFTPAALGSSTATIRIPSNAASRYHSLLAVGNGVDARPPSSSFTTEDGEILIGVGLNIVVATLGVDNAVTGSSIDDLSGIRRVDVIFRGEFETRRMQARLACDAPQTTCTWTAIVPMTPGEYVATATATDRYDNVEAAGPSVRILVI